MSSSYFRFVFVASAIAKVVLSTSAYNIVGTINCFAGPYWQARIAIYEMDVNHQPGQLPFTSDPYCYGTQTDVNGQFSAAGYEDQFKEAGQLYVIVKHDCNSPSFVCTRFDVPMYVWTRDSTDAVMFDIGTVEMMITKRVECPSNFDAASTFKGPECAHVRY
ncbi:hypothetical protein M3Y94_00915400 [Aphelenchoides besseyi]|nr:hypothetical protein M3Y94_00915400 [Aphelenchoides besseyi]KAI6223238.1 hypothetical protein M3Y95_00868400 [Aphelenchoides besseyi]